MYYYNKLAFDQTSLPNGSYLIEIKIDLFIMRLVMKVNNTIYETSAHSLFRWFHISLYPFLFLVYETYLFTSLDPYNIIMEGVNYYFSRSV